MKRQFAEAQNTNKHMKSCSTSLTTREARIKRRYHFYNHQIGKMIKRDNEDMESLTLAPTGANPSSTAGGNAAARLPRLHQIKHLQTLQPDNSAPGYMCHGHPHTCLEEKDAPALSVIGGGWKQSGRQLLEERLSRIQWSAVQWLKKQ